MTDGQKKILIVFDAVCVVIHPDAVGGNNLISDSLMPGSDLQCSS